MNYKILNIIGICLISIGFTLSGAMGLDALPYSAILGGIGGGFVSRSLSGLKQK